MTYSSSLAMGRQRYTATQKNTHRAESNQKTIGPISNTIMLVVLVCLLGLIYLTQVTKTNALGYRINDLKTQSDKLKNENDDLAINAARLQSLERVKNSSVANSLVSLSSSDTIQN